MDPPRDRPALDRLRREEAWYLAEKGRPPTPEELATKLDVDAAGLTDLLIAETEVVRARHVEATEPRQS